MFVENSICSAGTLSVTRTVQVAMCPKVSWPPVIKTPVVIEKHHLPYYFHLSDTLPVMLLTPIVPIYFLFATSCYVSCVCSPLPKMSDE